MILVKTILQEKMECIGTFHFFFWKIKHCSEFAKFFQGLEPHRKELVLEPEPFEYWEPNPYQTPYLN